MIRPALIILSVSTVILFAACDSDQQDQPHRHRYGYESESSTEVAPTPDDQASPSPAPGPETSNTGPIAPPPPSPPPPPGSETNPAPGASGTPGDTRKDYPYAQPVAGKPGFVTSPYAPYSGYVDVRGFPPGTEVKDPYTQKIFLVP